MDLRPRCPRGRVVFALDAPGWQGRTRARRPAKGACGKSGMLSSSPGKDGLHPSFVSICGRAGNLCKNPGIFQAFAAAPPVPAAPVGASPAALPAARDTTVDGTRSRECPRSHAATAAARAAPSQRLRTPRHSVESPVALERRRHVREAMLIRHHDAIGGRLRLQLEGSLRPCAVGNLHVDALQHRLVVDVLGRIAADLWRE